MEQYDQKSELFINAVGDNDLKKVKFYVKKKSVNPSYDNNLAIRIAVEDGLDEIFHYLLTEIIIDFSLNNFYLLKQSLYFQNKNIYLKIISILSNTHNLNQEWLNIHIENTQQRQSIKAFLNINYF